MFSKIDVNGETAAPLYKFLTSAAPNAEGDEPISWNFEKFLVSRDGETVTRFAPQTTPEEIAALLPEHL